MPIPATKAARQAHIRQILRSQVIRSQAELADALAGDDVLVTQATLSRDLVEIGAMRVRDETGALRYQGRIDPDAKESVGMATAAFEKRMARLCQELLVTAKHSANIVMLSTPPGAANFLAQAIDQAQPEGVLGTLAGDDSVMVITVDPLGGEQIAEYFLALAETGRSS